MNWLLDKKYDRKEKYFEVPENPNYKQGVLMDDRFRLLCICNIEKVNSMSPAFVNRFDMIFLEDQLNGLNEEDLKNLIIILFEQSIEKIVNNNKNRAENIEIIKTEFDDYFCYSNDNNQNTENISELINANDVIENLFDEFGNIINEQQQKTDEFGNIIKEQQQKADEFGNIINEQQQTNDEFENKNNYIL